MIYPLPVVMVSLGALPEEYNIITIAWTGYALYRSAIVLYLSAAGTAFL